MSKELHVLHVVGAMNIGGIENMLMTLMPSMKEKGIIFDFAVHGENIGIHEGKIKELRGRVYHLPKFLGVNIVAYLNAWRSLLKKHPELEIIHGHMTSTASLYLWIAKRYGRVTIAHSHSTSTSGGRIMYGVKRMLEYPLRYLSDYLCACSAAAADYRFGKMTHNRSNFFLWHNAIDTDKFVFSLDKREKYREKLGIAENTVVIGHVGRMIPAKNHKFLLEIFAAYKQINKDSKLLLVGDGPLRNEIKKRSVENGLEYDIMFVGSVVNPEDYISTMDVFCFPSLYEGLAVSLIEAQTNGRLCVASNVIPHEVKISEGLLFLLLSDGPHIWAKKIEEILQKKKVECDLTNPYDIKVVTDEVESFYKKISRGFYGKKDRCYFDGRRPS